MDDNIVISASDGQMLKPGMLDASWARAGIQRELSKLRSLSEVEQVKHGKPGSVLSVCVIKIASLVKGCDRIEENSVKRSVKIILDNYHVSISPRSIETIWRRAMDNSVPRQRGKR